MIEKKSNLLIDDHEKNEHTITNKLQNIEKVLICTYGKINYPPKNTQIKTSIYCIHTT